MQMKNNHEIILKQYAAYCKEQPLYLGTAGSYGMEMLTIIREGVWAEYDILATFHSPVGAAVQVRVGANNQIGVPIEATAEEGMGEIVFAGYKEGVRQIAVDVLYKVAPSSGASGTEPAEPTPDVVQQILSAARNAEEIAKSVRADAEKIKERLDEIPKIDDTAITTTSPWSSKQIVDTLCPPIEETGNPVVCYPVAGYPLDVTVSWGPTQEGSGEPSLDNVRPIKGRGSVTVKRKEDGLTRRLTFSSTIYGGEVDVVTGDAKETWKTLTLDGKTNKFTGGPIYWNLPKNSAVGVGDWYLNNIYSSHFPSAFGGNANGNFIYTTADIMTKYFQNADALNDYLAAQYAAGTPVQICYKLKEPVPFTAAGAQPIPALSGTNTLFTDADSVSVSGRADLIHIIRKMQEK